MQIPGFEMLDKLGEGGMASVWKARQVSLDRTVAIKMLSPRFAADPADVQRFQSEAQSAAKLKHIGIVQVYDANVESGVYYFVMEFIDGYTVGDWLHRVGVIPEKEALLVVECVAEALKYAWEREHIVHCDIKPDNVMIDSDGTVKVADLGLSRTVSLMARKTISSEILGTPAYMSPEQARGESDLDCRTDIYSLGATLYHMVTGKLPFEGRTEEEMVDGQIRGTIEDPLDVNRKLTKPVCWLIEKMLAKKRDHRHKEWGEVIADIKRVKRKLIPAGVLPADGLSTIQRSSYRGKTDTVRTHGVEQKSSISMPAKIAIGAGVGAIAVVVMIAMFQSNAPEGHPAVPAPHMAPLPVESAEADYDRRAREVFEYAKKFATDNPDKFDDCITQYQRAVIQSRGTRYALMAEDEVKRLSAQRDLRLNEVIEKLKAEVAGMIDRKEWDEATRVFRDYNGSLAAETRSKRLEIVAKIEGYKRQFREREEKEKADIARKVEDLAVQVVEKLAVGDPVEALSLTGKALADPVLAGSANLFKGLEKCIRDLMAVDERILDSFRTQAGNTLAVTLSSGKINMTILSVRDGKVQGKVLKDVGGRVIPIGHAFCVKDMVIAERMSRMGADDQPGVALAKGLLALESKAYSHARKYFEKVDPILGERLLAYLTRVEQGIAGGVAEEALAAVLRAAGVSVGAFDAEAWGQAVAAKTVDAEGLGRIQSGVAEFRKVHGESDFARKAAPVLAALEALKADAEPQPPLVADLRRDVPDVPPDPPRERRVPLKETRDTGAYAKVVQDLVSRNPEMLAENVKFFTEPAGELRRVEIDFPMLVNISPIRGFDTVRELYLGGVPFNQRDRSDVTAPLSELGVLRSMSLDVLYLGQTMVSDLSAISGMRLRELYIGGTQVSSLTAVKNMPLEVLDIQRTSIKDLTPIKGMRLTELNLSGTKAFDFSPLAGMPLRSLDLSSTQVKDLGFIKGMPLENLNLAESKVYTFPIIRSLPLRSLNVRGTQIKDISFLKGQRLEALDVGDTGIRTLEGMEGMPLRSLSVARTHVRDFGPVQNAPLVHLDVAGCNVSDISFTENMPLNALIIENTNVSDLSPLKGKSLRYLNISGTGVRNLVLVSRLPLNHLSCRRIKDVDLSPLRQSSIERLDVDRPLDNLEVLRAMPNLRIVNGLPLLQLVKEGRPRRR